MNWLAHLLLSEPTPAFRIGNMLPDMLRLSDLNAMPTEFQCGIARHRAIDAFTDSHPVVRRSIERIQPPFRRWGGVLVDVFYDHFLARDWPLYSLVPLDDFAQQIYRDFDLCREHLPPQLRAQFQQMKYDDWLCSYREIDGIETALRRIEGRLRKPFALHQATRELENNYDELADDFREFFPQLAAQTANDE
ncbi:MAG TPA: ACP phosphodiesterase [Abditibacteriaceae bacterium]|nr:ACP phosphodiesterase [Abditibacteriaceae bacterium]